jgi:segregation and condensation protein B
MSLKAKIEAIIYAAETPITLEQIVELVKDSVEGSNGTQLKSQVLLAIEELRAEYLSDAHGIEIRQIAGGYRMSTKPEQHDLVRSFAKSLKPPIRLSLPALETLAVIAYKQPVTVPEISEIRGVDSSGVIATLLDRKVITTSGRKDVIGRPILYKTTKEFLLRFGLKDVNELPSMEEFEKLVAESFQSDLLPAEEAQTRQASQAADQEQEPAKVEAEKSA